MMMDKPALPNGDAAERDPRKVMADLMRKNEILRQHLAEIRRDYSELSQKLRSPDKTSFWHELA